MTYCFMTGRPPTCSDSTDVPVVPSVGKLQTTLQSHAGRQGDHLIVPTTIDSCFTLPPLPRVGCYNTVCRKLRRASPPLPSPPPPPSPLHSMKRSRAAGALYIVNKMCVHVLFGIFPRGTKDTCSQLSRHWSVTGQSSINRSRTFRIDPSEKIG